MEQTIKKVEEALHSLGFRFVFEKKELHDGTVKYVSPSEFSISGYGMTFGVGLCVELCRVNGIIAVEYQVAEYFGDADKSRGEIINKLISNGVEDINKVESIYKTIFDYLDDMYKWMFELFAEDFEMSLPDVYIVDPIYRENPSK